MLVQEPPESITIWTLDLSTEGTRKVTPRFRPPGSEVMAGPSQPAWASTVQTRLSTSVTPPVGAGTEDGARLWSEMRVTAEKPASGGTLIVTSPSPKLR